MDYSRNSIVLNEKRFQCQINVATSILNYPLNSYINVYPRVGKTFIAFIVASKNEKVTYIVVPNQQLKSDMVNELNKIYHYGNKDFVFNQNIEIYTKDELMNLNILCQPDRQYDLIIDEIHKYNSGGAQTALMNYLMLPNVRMIGMTGTPNEVPLILGMKLVHYIGEEEAIDNNFISSGKEYAIPLSFNQSEQSDYITYSNIIAEQLSLFRNIYKLLGFRDELDCLYCCSKGKVIGGVYQKAGRICDMVATQMGWHNQLDTSNDYNKKLELNFNPNNLLENSKKATDFIDKRNDLMNNNISKVSAVLNILSKTEGASIVFTGTKKLAELIYTNLNKTDVGIYYSSMPNRYCYDVKGDIIKDKEGNPKMIGTARQKTLLLEKLRLGIINTILTPESLQEGFTEKAITTIIVCNGSENNIVDIQRKGRAKTYVEGKEIKIYNIYFDDFEYGGELIKCRDKQKFLKRVNNINDIIFEN